MTHFVDTTLVVEEQWSRRQDSWNQYIVFDVARCTTLKVIEEFGERLRFRLHNTQEYLKEVEEYLKHSRNR